MEWYTHSQGAGLVLQRLTSCRFESYLTHQTNGLPGRLCLGLNHRQCLAALGRLSTSAGRSMMRNPKSEAGSNPASSTKQLVKDKYETNDINGSNINTCSSSGMG